MANKYTFAAFGLAVLLLLGGICLLGAGIEVYNYDPNRVVFSRHTSDGRPDPSMYQAWNGLSNNGFNTAGGITYPDGFQGTMVSCDKVTTSFHRNASYELKLQCRLEQNELAFDANGDGEYGDEKGFIYPGAPPVYNCENYNPVTAETCTLPYRCPSVAESGIKYYDNEEYVRFMNERCKANQPGRELFIGTGVFVVVNGLFAIFYALLESRTHSLAPIVGKVTISLTIASFFLMIASSSYFMNFTPVASFQVSYTDCSAMSAASYYQNALAPSTECFVEDPTCDPYDYTEGFFPNTENKVGKCIYQAPDLVKIPCHKASEKSKNDKVVTAIEECENVDCDLAIPGDFYTTLCCQERRKCCGDNADCDDQVVCLWSNSTVTGADSKTTVEANQCFNEPAVTSTKCNDDQKKAFEARLRTQGVCFPSPFIVPSEESNPSSTFVNMVRSEKCEPNRKEQLIAAATYMGGEKFPNETYLAGLTRDKIEKNLPECLVEEFSQCQSACSMFPSIVCGGELPLEGALGNCTFTHGICKPNKALYDTEEKQKAHPMEYCESLLDPTDDTTLAASKVECTNSKLCYWRQNQCFARSCINVNSYGYMPDQNPPCLPMVNPSSGFVAPQVKRCKFPEKGCTSAQDIGMCPSILTSASPWYYYQSSSLDTFAPGPVFTITECEALGPEKCGDTTYTGVGCVLLKGSDDQLKCVSPYSPCKGAIADAGRMLKGENEITQARSRVSGSNCFNDKDGNIVSPIFQHVILVRNFFLTGCVFTGVATLALIMVQSQLAGPEGAPTATADMNSTYPSKTAASAPHDGVHDAQIVSASSPEMQEAKPDT